MEIVYLAHAIDHANPDQAQKTRDLADYTRAALSKAGIATYSPGLAWTVGQGQRPRRELQDVNNQAINRADGLIALYSCDVVSFGVPAEIQYAVNRKTPVVIVTSGGLSWAMPQGPLVRVVEVTDGLNWADGIDRGISWLRQAETKRRAMGRERAKQQVLKFAPVEMLTVPGFEPKLPTRAYGDDAGLDLYVNDQIVVPAGGFVDVPCGVAVELPEWSWGFLVGRSSTLRKRKLLVNPGIIDCGYRGELYAGVQNMADHDVPLDVGDRIAQLIVLGNATRNLNPVMAPSLDPHPRGSNGFGSSGV